MFRSDDSLILSASDLSNFLACPHQSHLDRAVAFGARRPPMYEDPSLEALRQRGLQHEEEYLSGLEMEGLTVNVVDDPGGPPTLHRYRQQAARTLEVMRLGADVIYQGVLFDGRCLGRPDFLRKVDRPSRLGGWSYEVYDAKLAREAKGGAVLQILFYADLLERAQGAGPEHVHLVLGGPERRTESFPVAEFAAYYRLVCSRLEEWLASAPDPFPVAPDPVEHCVVCDWRARCDEERREVDHLSFVAGITRRQRDALAVRGIAKLADLALLRLPLPTPLDGVNAESLQRVREQARIQLEGRNAGGKPIHELLRPVVAGQGLAALPEPTPQDLFLDLEGNPFALEHGLEYLFGFVDTEGAYTGLWALDRAAEKTAFERFVDIVMGRLERHPGMHVYHFAPYENTAFKRLMGFHATRESEIDHLLRAGVFVDLYRVVRQGLRASVESYSIKKLEPFYGYGRRMELREASSALNRFDALLEVGLYQEEREALAHTVELYNRDDCVSTLRLRDWLERLRAELERHESVSIPRPALADTSITEAHAQRRAEVAARMDALLVDVPVDPGARTPEQQGRWLLAQLLEFHRREEKSFWWEYYRCLELPEDEWVEDRSVLGGLQYVGVVGTEKRSEIHRYRFPPQDHAVKRGKKAVDPETKGSAGEIVALDDATGTIDLRRGTNRKVPNPRGLVAADNFNDTVLRESLLRIADAMIAHGFAEANPFRAALDLLLRRRPRAAQSDGAPLMMENENSLDAALRAVCRLDRTVLPIQGPPGAGKTFTGARMIIRALAEGKRVGVTALSHKVISHLLTEACVAARETRVELRGIQKAKEEDRCSAGEIALGDNAEVLAALQSGRANVAAGTAWLWSREEMINSVDLLFVDEAGQFPLANALAVAPAAGSLVLLGDPRQLEQPLQGTHPPGASASALDHLLNGAQTILPDRGLFLPRTWRLHPEITAFTSEAFYEGRLHSRAGLEAQEVRSSGSLRGSGLRIAPVAHTGNGSDSLEEVEVVDRLVRELLDGGASWVDGDGVERRLTLQDILVVTPYNAQVAALVKRLPAGARVGTVDKFQGQQAPISIYSVATSSAVDAPRGMDFLYNPNRLNVATSRAKCLTVVVAAPEVFAPEARAPKQMRLANGWCRYRELANQVDPLNAHSDPL